MNPPPRVAFFTDSFHEINGVAHTSRHFDAFARRRGLPFLNVHAGPKTALTEDGPVWTLEIQRSAVGFGLEHDMSFDLLFLRHRAYLADILKRFEVELIHITGPSDIGILGVMLAHQLKLPLVASWHTNIHEFGARRLSKTLAFLPAGLRHSITQFTEQDIILALSLRYYKLARVLLAPNRELVDLLHQRTNKPAFLMQRGVDTVLFSPEKRDRTDDVFTVGYVGRLSPEKSVRVLHDVERALEAAGISNFRIVVVGDGHERGWLDANLKHVEFRGVLRGEDLARAYANMDVFAFPSHTDTFGNVILESLASGVPTVVTTSGGPKYLVMQGVTGLISADAPAFLANVVTLAKDPDLLRRMRLRAREFALCRYWNRIFDQVYDAYEYCLHSNRPSLPGPVRPAVRRRFA
jgi:glycosyltransferase involved in cell wall biosynthesis